MQKNLSATERKIFEIKTEKDFEELALEIFLFQSEKNEVYKSYLRQLNVVPQSITSIPQIPFLPVEFFKSHRVIIQPDGIHRLPAVQPVKPVTFTSSSTTGVIPGCHFVADVSLYEKSFLKCFEHFYGSPGVYCILALLPSYLERDESSLVYMMKGLIKKSGHEKSGFYLNQHEELAETLIQLKNSKQKTILVGVTFALLDFIEKHPVDFPDLVVMETGGMKGRRREMVREELHTALCKGFGVQRIHSEYGMTELLSQAYSKGNGLFITPPWMKILIRDPNDPFNLVPFNQTGGINVIDFANIYSASFIATQDLGRSLIDGSFEVLGRFDNSDVRGCNLMAG